MNLKTYLNKNKITIVDFAKIALLTPGCIHHLISGRRKNIALLTAVCVQMASNNEVKIVDLLGYERVRLLGSKIQKNIDKRENELVKEKKNGKN
jgi:predicted transcriptional regulator